MFGPAPFCVYRHGPRTKPGARRFSFGGRSAQHNETEKSLMRLPNEQGSVFFANAVLFSMGLSELRSAVPVESLAWVRLGTGARHHAHIELEELSEFG